MGLGDELLAAGQAKLLGGKVAIYHKGKPVRNELYRFIPYLSPNGRRYEEAPYRRYISSIERNPKRVRFNHDYRPEPAGIRIDPLENDYVIIEPTVKREASPAKQWHHYQEVVDALPYKFLQFRYQTLSGVDSVKTSLYEAARLMAGCRFYVGTEGFLHHLAAALGKPAVVIIGAYSPPEVIGYPFHINLSVDDPEELGSFTKTGAMERISPDMVIEACRSI